MYPKTHRIESGMYATGDEWKVARVSANYRDGWHLLTPDDHIIGTYGSKAEALEVYDEMDELTKRRFTNGQKKEEGEAEGEGGVGDEARGKVPTPTPTPMTFSEWARRRFAFYLDEHTEVDMFVREYLPGIHQRVRARAS